MLDLVASYPRFFSDISALTLPNRFKMLLMLRKNPTLQERLLFGTDYPLPVFHLPAWGRVGLHQLSGLIKTGNRFDRQYLVCHLLGLRFGSLGQIISS